MALFSRQGVNGFAVPESTVLQISDAVDRNQSLISLDERAIYWGDIQLPSHRALKQKLLEVVVGLSQHPLAAPFLFPFDVSGLHGYTTLVMNPIDISMVATRVLSNYYARGVNNSVEMVAEFQDDLVDVFLNCCSYHQAGSRLCADALNVLMVLPKYIKDSGLPLLHCYVDEGSVKGSTDPLTLAVELKIIHTLRINEQRLRILTSVEPLLAGIPSSIDRLSELAIHGSFRSVAEFHRSVDAMYCSAISSLHGDLRLEAVASRNSLPSLVRSALRDTVDVASRSAFLQFSSATIPLNGREDPWMEECLSSGGLSETMRSKLLRVVCALQAFDTQQVFSFPVLDPQYCKMIIDPVDFTTIKFKITKGLYPSVDSVLHDIELIYDNCLAFNGPGHPLSKAAAELRSRLPDLLHEHSVV